MLGLRTKLPVSRYHALFWTGKKYRLETSVFFLKLHNLNIYPFLSSPFKFNHNDNNHIIAYLSIFPNKLLFRTQYCHTCVSFSVGTFHQNTVYNMQSASLSSESHFSQYCSSISLCFTSYFTTLHVNTVCKPYLV